MRQVGLFASTPEQKVYPNPAAASVVPDAYALFEFLGKMLGKALYEVGSLRPQQRSGGEEHACMFPGP